MEMKAMNRKYAVLGAPFYHPASVVTENNETQQLRESDLSYWNGLHEWLAMRINSHWKIDVEDRGNIGVSLSVQSLLEQQQTVSAVQGYTDELKQGVMNIYRDGRTPIVVGGDHSISIATISAMIEHFRVEKGEKVAVVWLDAHANCNNTLSGNIHGKPLAMLMGMTEHTDWRHDPALTLMPEDLFYFGVREIMGSEAEIIDKHNIRNYRIDEIDTRGIDKVTDELVSILSCYYDRYFVSVDYSVLDGAVFRSCASPSIGGLSSREALYFIKRLCGNDKFAGIDFVEYLPELDADGMSKDMMVKMIDAVWGSGT